MMMEAEDGVRLPGTMPCLGPLTIPQGLGHRPGAGPPSEPPQGTNSAHPWILDFWPPHTERIHSSS